MKHIVITQPMGLTRTQLADLQSLGKVTYYDTICKNTDEWIERVNDADIIYSNNYGLDAGWRQVKNVYITYPFVTTSFLDSDVLKKNNVIVSNSPGCNQIAVTEWIVAMLINYFENSQSIVKQLKSKGQSHQKQKVFTGNLSVSWGKGRLGNELEKRLKP